MSNPSNIRFAQFFHRRNPDESFESICGLCFQSVATAGSKDALKVGESVHICLTPNWFKAASEKTM